MPQPGTSSFSLYKPVFHQVWKLKSSIGAIRTVNALTDARRSGVFEKLPVGALLIVVGAGFDETTVRVQCRGFDYVVFSQDLLGEHLVSGEKSPLLIRKPA